MIALTSTVIYEITEVLSYDIQFDFSKLLLQTFESDSVKDDFLFILS